MLYRTLTLHFMSVEPLRTFLKTTPTEQVVHIKPVYVDYSFNSTRRNVWHFYLCIEEFKISIEDPDMLQRVQKRQCLHIDPWRSFCLMAARLGKENELFFDIRLPNKLEGLKQEILESFEKIIGANVLIQNEGNIMEEYVVSEDKTGNLGTGTPQDLSKKSKK
jgi:hypothetical protein